MKTNQANTVEEYISEFPKEIQMLLTKVRQVIIKTCPEALESISYGMPAYKLYGKPLVYFGAYANHIGLYATPSGHSAFADSLSKYKQGKGSVQFPFSQSIPFDLIGEMVAHNAKNIKKKK